MRNLLIAGLAILLSGYSAFGQQATYKLAGKVVDESTSTALPGVGILESVVGLGTVTNQEGEFSIGVRSFPIQLIFKHLGYFDDTLKITNKDQYRKYYEGVTIN